MAYLIRDWAVWFPPLAALASAIEAVRSNARALGLMLRSVGVNVDCLPVLDVRLIRKWAHTLGGHVTLVPVEGALHDVTMSRAEVRKVVFDQIARWHDAFLT